MRPRVIFFLDCLALLASVFAIAIEFTGGFHTTIAGVRVSGRSVDRALFAAALAIGVRLWLDRRTPYLRIDRRRWRDARDWLVSREADAIAEPTTSMRAWQRYTLAMAGFCLVGGVLLYPQLRAMYSVPDFGDPLFSIWRMGWVYRQLLGDPRPLFDANIFYPAHLTLTYSDSMLLPALTGAPLLALGVHPVLTYNLVFLSGFLLSGIATYLLVERLTGCPRAAFISALIYGFYPYRFEHYSHLELQMTHWMPLALLALHRFSETARLRYALLAALAVVAQLYSSMYYGVFFVIYGTTIFVLLALAARMRLRSLFGPVLIAGALAAILAVPLIRPYNAAQAVKGIRETSEVLAYSATPLDYLRAHQRSATWGTRMVGGRRPERALFPGVVPLALTAVALVPPIGFVRLAYAVGLFVAYDNSLGLNGLIYPYLYEWFSPMRGIRVAARFSVITGLSLAILAGFGMRRLLRRLPTRAAHAAFAAGVVAVAIDTRPILELRPVWREPPPIYAALGPPEQTVLAEFPFPHNWDALPWNTHYMYFSLWHGAWMVNGYSGFVSPDYEPLMITMREFPDPRAVEFLRQRGVTHVTVNCAFYRGPCGSVLQAFDQAPGLQRVAEGRWLNADTVLYRLVQ